MSRLGFDPVSVKMRSASLNGSGRRSTASTTLNTAVLAPTPKAIVATAMAVNPFEFHSDRMASRMGLHEVTFAGAAGGGGGLGRNSFALPQGSNGAWLGFTEGSLRLPRRWRRSGAGRTAPGRSVD